MESSEQTGGQRGVASGRRSSQHSRISQEVDGAIFIYWLKSISECSLKRFSFHQQSTQQPFVNMSSSSKCYLPTYITHWRFIIIQCLCNLMHLLPAAVHGIVKRHLFIIKINQTPIRIQKIQYLVRFWWPKIKVEFNHSQKVSFRALNISLGRREASYRNSFVGCLLLNVSISIINIIARANDNQGNERGRRGECPSPTLLISWRKRSRRPPPRCEAINWTNGCSLEIWQMAFRRWCGVLLLPPAPRMLRIRSILL